MIFTAPESTCNSKRTSFFLAGSIEQGKAENWQVSLAKTLDCMGFDVFNPRRKEWDSSWEQSYNNPQFYQQVNWELSNLEKADNIVFYFDPITISPITLFELGLAVATNYTTNIYVICPDGYFRKGNIEVICDKYNICLFNSIQQFTWELENENN